MTIVAQLADPFALAIVAGGTALGVVLRTPAPDLARAIRSIATLGRRRFSADPLIDHIAAQARIARNHGTMALERSVIADPDIAVALAAIVDGGDGARVGALLTQRRQARVERHVRIAEVWAGAAELAPAMGMVGTLVGLARMFATMTDPAAIGGAMAIALLATLYGALLANLVFMPIANRLRVAGRIEAFERARIEAPLVALANRERPQGLRASARDLPTYDPGVAAA